MFGRIGRGIESDDHQENGKKFFDMLMNDFAQQLQEAVRDIAANMELLPYFLLLILEKDSQLVLAAILFFLSVIFMKFLNTNFINMCFVLHFLRALVFEL